MNKPRHRIIEDAYARRGHVLPEVPASPDTSQGSVEEDARVEKPSEPPVDGLPPSGEKRTLEQEHANEKAAARPQRRLPLRVGFWRALVRRLSQRG